MTIRSESTILSRQSYFKCRVQQLRGKVEPQQQGQVPREAMIESDGVQCDRDRDPADLSTQGRDSTGKPATGGRIANIAALSAAHISCDAHLSFIPPLWPVIRGLYALSNTDIGLLTALLSLTTNFGQILSGYLTDRFRLSRLVLLSVLITSIFVSTIGFMPSLAGVVLFLMMAGVGAALLHPRAAALAAAWRPRQAAFGLGIFGGAGTLGFALGSLAGAGLYQYFGSLKGLLPALAFGLGVAVFVALVDPERAEQQTEPPFSLRRHLLPRLGRIGPLFAIITLRSAAATAFVNFMPLLLEARGAGLITGGAAVFVFVSGTAVGALVGGRLVARVDERRLTIISLLLAVPLLITAVMSTGATAFASLFVGGFMLRCADYVNIAQTQAIIPEGASMGAAIGLGAAWGVGGLVAPLVGHMADVYGWAAALAGTMVLPAGAALIAMAVKFDAGQSRKSG